MSNDLIRQRDQRVIWLYGQDSIKVSYHYPAKFVCHRQCGSGNTTFVTRINSAFYSFSKLEYGNLNSYFHWIQILWCDRIWHGGGVACYIRNGLSYNFLPVFSREIESIFFEILLPNSKPITGGTIYCPPNQSNFLEVLNEKMNKIDSISDEIYIPGDFNVNLSLNDSYIVSKKTC